MRESPPSASNTSVRGGMFQYFVTQSIFHATMHTCCTQVCFLTINEEKVTNEDCSCQILAWHLVKSIDKPAQVLLLFQAFPPMWDQKNVEDVHFVQEIKTEKQSIVVSNVILLCVMITCQFFVLHAIIAMHEHYALSFSVCDQKTFQLFFVNFCILDGRINGFLCIFNRIIDTVLFKTRFISLNHLITAYNGWGR